MINVLIVGGTFDHTPKGKPSSLIDVITQRVVRRKHTVTTFNGGNVDALRTLFEEAGKHDVVLWFPNVPDNYDKNISAFKQIYPKVFLVTSKRNDDNKYSFAELINHALGLKANLVVEFYKFCNRFQGRVFDPLGCVWGQSEDFGELTDKLFERIEPLLELTREGSRCLGKDRLRPAGPGYSEFYDIVKDYGSVFHDLVHPADGVERFLGNASFRCERGFPSFKCGGVIFVSRRNVDKRYIDEDAFVQVMLTGDAKTPEVGYFGDHKPSVDAPIQLRLYRYYHNVKYMLHSHVYIKNAPFTACVIPCGALEEVDETIYTQRKNELSTNNFVLNLLGHGSIVFADNVDYLRGIAYYARPIPEEMS